MPAEVIRGVKETAKTLRRIDPELRKEFNDNVKQITSPIVDAAKASYSPSQVPSGTLRVWTQRGRKIFPFSIARAKSGVRSKVDTRSRSRSSIKVVQANPAAAIYEFAGDATDNALGRAFTRKGRRPARVMWPAAERNIRPVQDEMKRYVKEVERDIEKALR